MGKLALTYVVLGLGLAWSQTLSEPTFVNETSFWREHDGTLVALLPNPNSDGEDPSTSSDLTWEFALVQNGAVIWGPIDVESPTWPSMVRIGPENSLPKTTFFIQLKRQSAGNLFEESPAVLRNGPLEELVDPGSRQAFNRWLIHLPKKAGGYNGVVRLLNLNPNGPADVELVGFDGSGNELARQAFELEAGEQRLLGLYETGELGLFGSFVDQVSHIGIWDGNAQTRVAINYQNASTGFGAWMEEFDFSKGLQSGNLFRLNSGIPSDDYFDGVAVTNLKCDETVTVHVWRFDGAGNEAGDVELGTIAPGTKLIRVLNDLFDTFVPNPGYFFQAQGSGGQESIQVLGLTGSRDGAFLAGLNAIKIR